MILETFLIFFGTTIVLKFKLSSKRVSCRFSFSIKSVTTWTAVLGSMSRLRVKLRLKMLDIMIT